MSLLNEMLNDLNENKSRVKATPSYILTHKSFISQTVIKATPWVVGVVVCSLIVLILMQILHFAKEKLHFKAVEKITTPVLLESFVSQIPAFSKTPMLASLSLSLNTQSRLIGSEKILPAFQLPAIPELMPKEIAKAEPSKRSKSEHAKDVDVDNAMHKIFNELTLKQWHDVQFNKALQAIERGDELHAIRLLESIIKKYPSSIETRESLAVLYMGHSKHTEAKNILEQGFKYEPNSLSLNMMKARLLFEEEKPLSALKILQRFHPNLQSEPDFYGLMAALLQTVGRVDEAGSIYKRLIVIEPSNGQYWLGHGIALEHQHLFQQACGAYQKASESYELSSAARTYAEARVKILQG